MLKMIWSDFENERFFVFFGIFLGKFKKICTFLTKFDKSSKTNQQWGLKIKSSKCKQIAKFIKEISRVSCELLSGE